MRHLADMSFKPKQSVYKPPPKRLCREVNNPIPLTEDDQFVIRIVTYREWIVDFAITQSVMVRRNWVIVARIDCDWGTVHRHLYDQDGKDLLDHEVLYAIPTVKGEELITRVYDEAYDIMENDWERNLRRWRGDGA